MTATGRLFWIETRRSVGLWAFPVLAGLAWLGWRINQDAAGHSGSRSGRRPASTSASRWPFSVRRPAGWPPG